jgi:hypothetical protein
MLKNLGLIISKLIKVVLQGVSVRAASWPEVSPVTLLPRLRLSRHIDSEETDRTTPLFLDRNVVKYNVKLFSNSCPALCYCISLPLFRVMGHVK